MDRQLTWDVNGRFLPSPLSDVTSQGSEREKETIKVHLPTLLQ